MSYSKVNGSTLIPFGNLIVLYQIALLVCRYLWRAYGYLEGFLCLSQLGSNFTQEISVVGSAVECLYMQGPRYLPSITK